MFKKEIEELRTFLRDIYHALTPHNVQQLQFNCIQRELRSMQKQNESIIALLTEIRSESVSIRDILHDIHKRGEL